MTDIPDFQVALIIFGSVAMWFCGFAHGKWYGIQKAEARYRLQRQALAASRKRNIER